MSARESVSSAITSDPVRSLDNLRPTPAKVGLASDHRRTDSVAAVMRDAVIGHYGSVKAAAISLRVDPSLMQREFDAGKFARLEQADDETKAAVARALYDAFGSSDPKTRAQRLIREARQRLDELSEALTA